MRKWRLPKMQLDKEEARTAHSSTVLVNFGIPHPKAYILGQREESMR